MNVCNEPVLYFCIIYFKEKNVVLQEYKNEGCSMGH